MKITEEARIQTITEFDNTKDSTVQSKEAQSLKRTELGHKVHDGLTRTFLIKKDLLQNNFVEAAIYNDLFELSGKDMYAIDLSETKLNSAVSSVKDDIKMKHDDLQLAINNLSSIIDWVSLYNSVAFSNIKILQETFSSNDSILSGSSSLLVDTFEGKITLQTTKITPISLTGASFVLNDISNGTFDTNKPIANAFDGSDISYTEYIQDVSVDKLDLDFTVTMQDASIINQIVIKPNDFSSQNWLNVKDIQTSLNGIDYYSINDANAFYRSSLFINTSGNTGFILDPSKNGYSNNFVIDFQPIKAKYIRFVFSQDKLDPLTDMYRIGISEININRTTYKASGSTIIAKQIDVGSLKSLSLKTVSGSEVDSKLLSIDYQISFDMAKWYDIQPVRSLGSLPEILNFNQDWLADSTDLSDKKDNMIYLKISMKKNIDPNNIERLLSNYTIPAMKIIDFPKSDPYSVTLNNPAVEDTLQLFSVPYMSAGKQDTNEMTIGITNPITDLYNIDLPFDPQEMQEIIIDGMQIPEYKDLNDAGDLVDGNALGYFIDNKKLHIHIPKNKVKRSGSLKEPWIGKFDDRGSSGPPPVPMGANTSPVTDALDELAKIPEDQATRWDKMRKGKDIILRMNAETKKLATRTFTLKHHSDGINKNIEITRTKLDGSGNVIVESVTDIIHKGKTKIKLSGHPLDNQNISIVGGYRVPFKDGFSEFMNASEFAFSIDFENRMLYLRNEYKQSVHISYERELKETLLPDDFKLDIDAQTVTIREWAYDPSATYIIKYNIAVKIPTSYYLLSPDGKTINISGEAIINSIYGKSEYADKKIKITYNFRENLRQIISDITESLSPVLNEISIIYSTDTL